MKAKGHSQPNCTWSKRNSLCGPDTLKNYMKIDDQRSVRLDPAESHEIERFRAGYMSLETGNRGPSPTIAIVLYM